MDDTFFDAESEGSDWLEMIDEAVDEAMEHFDIDSLAPTGSPKDWVCCYGRQEGGIKAGVVAKGDEEGGDGVIMGEMRLSSFST